MGSGSGDGTNHTDYFQSLYDYVAPGAVINASAMMMSHADDWIGKTGIDGEFEWSKQWPGICRVF